MGKRNLMFIAGFLTLAAAIGWGQDTSDPLSAFCYGTSSCTSNGTVTPVNQVTPQFGFTSTLPHTEDFLIEVLIPDNYTDQSFTITGTQGGPTNTSSISQSTTRIPGDWNSGFLTAFLGYPTIPVDRLDLWLPTTQADDPGANGYFVEQADLGITDIRIALNSGLGPQLNIGTLPVGTIVAAFLADGSGGYESTLPAGALYATPEPTSIILFGSVSLFALIGARKVQKRR